MLSNLLTTWTFTTRPGYENPRVQETRCGSVPGIVTRVYLSHKTVDRLFESANPSKFAEYNIEFDSRPLSSIANRTLSVFFSKRETVEATRDRDGTISRESNIN